MSKRELERLLDLLGKLTEQEDIDGETRDRIARIRDLVWNLLEAKP